MERLQKIISSRGICSRRTAEQWITEGRVSVNGKIAILGDQADDHDTILIDGTELPPKQEFVYIMLHKPRGYVTTLSDEKGRPTVAQLVDCGTRVFPIGRLDYNSEGLLLFTNDGMFADQMMHPKGNVPKTYLVTVEGDLNSAESRLSRPIELDGYRIRKPVVKKQSDQGRKGRFYITIYEGRNRQIRRMCEAADLRVLRLCRISEGDVSLGRLPLGKWRYLTIEEIQSLKEGHRHG